MIQSQDRAHITIVGGGIAFLAAAYYLQEKSAECGKSICNERQRKAYLVRNGALVPLPGGAV
jgi:glycine/D-amino acid oxidase-like deaminating enzyme